MNSTFLNVHGAQKSSAMLLLQHYKLQSMAVLHDFMKIRVLIEKKNYFKAERLGQGSAIPPVGENNSSTIGASGPNIMSQLESGTKSRTKPIKLQTGIHRETHMQGALSYNL